MTRVLRSDCGPSLKATAPASFSRPISAISSPWSPCVSAATGSTRTKAVVARAAQQEIDDRRLVDRRIGIRPRQNRRDAARRGRRCRGGDGLAMLRARLADKGAHVDEAGRHDVAAAIDDMRVRRQRRGDDLRPESREWSRR